MKENRSSSQIRSILPQSEYDSAAIVANVLYRENCLEEPSVEALALSTIRIIIEEYAENPQSLISYYKKNKKN